jgi:hypothetical protein
MGVQPVRVSAVRQLPDAGRAALALAGRVQTAARPLPAHLQLGARRAAPAAQQRAGADGGAGELALGAHQLRQGLGAQVLAAGSHGVPLLARGAAHEAGPVTSSAVTDTSKCTDSMFVPTIGYRRACQKRCDAFRLQTCEICRLEFLTPQVHDTRRYIIYSLQKSFLVLPQNSVARFDMESLPQKQLYVISERKNSACREMLFCIFRQTSTHFTLK